MRSVTGAACFQRAARLRKSREFAALRGGQRLACRHFHAEFRPSTLPAARLGLVVSKRVSKRAVDRNRLKRLARDSFRRCRLRLPCVDLVLIARPSAKEIPGPDLLQDLDTLWQRLSALKPALKPAQVPGTMRD
jgi:ribonuclease P protein component